MRLLIDETANRIEATIPGKHGTERRIAGDLSILDGDFLAQIAEEIRKAIEAVEAARKRAAEVTLD